MEKEMARVGDVGNHQRAWASICSSFGPFREGWGYASCVDGMHLEEGG